MKYLILLLPMFAFSLDCYVFADGVAMESKRSHQVIHYKLYQCFDGIDAVNYTSEPPCMDVIGATDIDGKFYVVAKPSAMLCRKDNQVLID